MDGPFDYVVVGAGSSGCVVASRLSEDGGTRVLLLEAGPSDKRLWVQVPLGYARSYYDPAVNWMLWSAPVPSLHNRSIYYPRGKVLGGSSAINAMVYARGQAEDFDGWRDEGNPGWGWEDVLPFYKRIEDHALGESAHHGAGGPVHVADISGAAHPLCRSFLAAAAEAGFPFNADLNGATAEGVGYYQITVQRGRRVSAARAYLDPARKRRNLRIETGAHVTRVLFEGRRAVGVEYLQGGKRKEVRSAREVVLSAGAFGSPHVLLLSGVGPAEALRSQGIGVVRDAPGVGRHLHDHACFDIYYRSSVPSLNTSLAGRWGQLQAALRYALFRRGPLAMSLNHAGGLVRTSAARARANLQLYFCPLAFDKPPAGSPSVILIDRQPAFTLSGSPCRPVSRGHVELASPDPLVAPAIHPNLLGHEDDIREAAEGFSVLRKIAASPALSSIAEESKPGGDVATANEVRDYLQSTSYSVFHPVGTCRMGPDGGRDVVDGRLRVHGLAGLRVIDAAIFPTVTSANTNAPAMMVGEKGAALILEDRRATG